MTSQMRTNRRNGAVTRQVLAWSQTDKSSAHATTRTGLATLSGRRGEASMQPASTPSRYLMPGTFGVLALILMAIVVSAIGARDIQAQEPQLANSVEAVFGTVVEVGEDTLTIATDDEINVIVITGDTTLRVDESFVDLGTVAVGDELAATVSTGADGSLTALKVLIRPSDAARSFIHVVGVVTAVEDGEITLTDGEGGTVTVDLPVGEVAPEIGEAVTTVAKRDRVTDRLAAQALEKAEAIVERLEAALTRAEEAIARTDNETTQAKLEDLKQRIQDNASRHLGLVDQVKATAISDVTAALDRKFEEAQRRYEDVSDRTGVDRPVVEAKGVVKTVTTDEIIIGLPNGGEIRISLDAASTSEDVDGQNTDVSAFVAGTDVVVEYNPTTGDDRTANTVKERHSELSQQEEDRIDAESEREFAGTITSVQRPSGDELSDAIAIVIIANEKSGNKVVARVTPGTEIKINGESARIDDLESGMLAEVELLSGFVASEIKARATNTEEQDIRGVVRKIDHSSGAIVIAAGNGQPTELRIDQASETIKNGNSVTLREIGPNDLVLDASRFRASDHTVVRLVLRSQEDIRVTGLIAGLDPSTSTVTVITDEGTSVQFGVNNDTKIDGPNGSKLRFAEITSGFRLVEGRITTKTVEGVTRHLATKLVVTPPELVTVRGEVLRVNPATGKLEISSSNGRDISVSLPEDGRFTIVKDGEQLDSLRAVVAGDLVHSATIQPASNTIIKLELLTPGGTAVRGTVRGVDSDEGRIKLEIASGESLELIADHNSQLQLDGHHISSLDRLEEGDVVVNALFLRRSSGNVVIHLEAVSAKPQENENSRSDQDERPNVEIRIKGVIAVIEGEIWLINDTKFLVGRETELEGDAPVVGAVASAILTHGDQDIPIALSVEIEAPKTRKDAPSPPRDSASEPRKVTFSGLVEAIGGDHWSVDGHMFTINRQTEVIGEPEVGARAGVVAIEISSGEFVAVQISVERTSSRFSKSVDVKPTPKSGDDDDSEEIEERGEADEQDDADELDDDDSSDSNSGDGDPSDRVTATPSSVVN